MLAVAPWFAAMLVGSCLAGCHHPALPIHPAQPPPPDATTQTVFVRIDSTSTRAALVRTGDGWGVECSAPCLRDVVIQQGVRYEIHAEGHVPTAPFEVYSKEDSAVWLAHEGVAPETKWAFGTATAVSGGLGLAMLVTAGALNTKSITRDAPDLPLALGVTGLVIGVPVCILFGVLTAVNADSDYEFRDPALPGFRF